MNRDHPDALIEQLLREFLGGDRPRDLTVRVMARARIYDRTRWRRWVGVGSAIAAAAAISVSIWGLWPQAYPGTHLVDGQIMVNAGNGDEIPPGSLVQTEPDETAHASIAIGGYVLVAMDKDTEITMGGSKYAEKVFLDHGDLDVDVTKKTGTFDVAVGSANVHVTGTKFHLAMRPKQVDGGVERNLVVRVREGSVVVSGIKDKAGNELPATSVTPGDPAVFPISFDPHTIRRVAPAASATPISTPAGVNEGTTAANHGNGREGSGTQKTPEITLPSKPLPSPTARGPAPGDSVLSSRPLQVVIDNGILEQNGILRRTRTNTYFLQNDARGPTLIFAQQPPFDNLPPVGSYVHVTWNDGRATKVELLTMTPTTTQPH